MLYSRDFCPSLWITNLCLKMAQSPDLPLAHLWGEERAVCCRTRALTVIKSLFAASRSLRASSQNCSTPEPCGARCSTPLTCPRMSLPWDILPPREHPGHLPTLSPAILPAAKPCPKAACAWWAWEAGQECHLCHRQTRLGGTALTLIRPEPVALVAATVTPRGVPARPASRQDPLMRLSSLPRVIGMSVCFSPEPRCLSG